MNDAFKLTDIESGMIKMVISRFITQKKSTPRRQLLIAFEEPNLLDQLVNRSLLRDINRQSYLPTLLAFETCADAETLSRAKEAVATVLAALKSLFKKNEDDKMFDAAEIAEEIRRIQKPLKQETLWWGLYFADEFQVLGGWQMNSDQTERTSVRVAEWVLKLKNAEMGAAWDNLVKQRMQWQLQREPYPSIATFRPAQDDPDLVEMAAGEEGAISVFISHSSKDSEIALGLIELLKAALRLDDDQIRCTSVDGFRLRAGEDTNARLKLEVRSAKAFIGLITPNSLRSAYVLFELGARWGAGLHMVPVLAGVAANDLSEPLKGINAISSDSELQLHQLVSDLGRTLECRVQSPLVYARYLKKFIGEMHNNSAHLERETVPPASAASPAPTRGAGSVKKSSLGDGREPISVGMEVHPSALRKIVLVLRRFTNPDLTLDWQLEFRLEQRSDPSMGFVSIADIALTLPKEIHQLVELTAQHGLDAAQQAKANVAADAVLAFYKGEILNEEAEEEINGIFSARNIR